MIKTAVIQSIVTIITAIVMCVSYVYTTFATKIEVEKKVEMGSESTLLLLREINKKLEVLDKRLWEMNNKGSK